MPDYGHRYADRKISEVDKQLKQTYRQAQKEMKQKLSDFEKRFAERSKQMKQMEKEGKISKQDYKDWLAGQVFVRQTWNSKIDQVNKVLNEHNNQAMKLINESRLDTFAENYNYQAYLAEGKMIGSFSLYNTQAVARLMLEDPDLLPQWKLDQAKDYAWNRQKINNIVTQGIIQGESIPEITKKLCEGLCSQDEDRMRTLARTMMTGAENAGRQQQMNDAAEMGIEVHKKWEATHDSRTRDSHRALDGEEVSYDENFSNGLEYPGDASGEPAEVYNCRCTMVTIYPKYENRDAARERYEDMEIDGQSYEEWKKYSSYDEWKIAKEEKGNLAYISTNGEGVIDTDIPGAEASTGNWEKLTKRIEYGELFDDAAVKITKDTLDKLYEEYPLSEQMGFVGDSRVLRNLDRTEDGLDLIQQYGFGAHFLFKGNSFVEGGRSGIEVLNENYSTASLLSEFRERHELRKRYGYATKATAFFTSSDTLEGTIIHEYAHGIQEEYGLAGGSRSKEAIMFSEWLYKYWENNKEDLRQISNYATDTPFEAMAEAYVQLHDIEHTDTIAYKRSKEIWDEFEEYRNRRGRYGK